MIKSFPKDEFEFCPFSLFLFSRRVDFLSCQEIFTAMCFAQKCAITLNRLFQCPVSAVPLCFH